MSQGSGYPHCMQDLIEGFSKMPGIGIRTAERLAFYILSTDINQAKELSDSILEVKNTVQYCKKCFNLSSKELCTICNDPTRDQHSICVVKEPKDINTLEKSGVYQGLYHVLLGSLSPLDGIGPEDIKISELIHRVQNGSVNEVIIATPSDTEGEATAIFLGKALKGMKIKVSRLAQGIPLGSALEFTDRATLMSAIQRRYSIAT